MKKQFLIGLLGFLTACGMKDQNEVNKLEAVSFSQVTITDEFWKSKMEKIAEITIPVMIYQTEVATGRIRNFEKAGRRQNEAHEGIYYDDSDVYKALEAIAYSLKTYPDATLEAKADEWIDKIASAQEEDGYINTYYSLMGLENRWQDMEKHEAYCAGHLIEAGVAYYQTTGKRKLLDVGRRMADHMDVALRQAGKPWVVGHEEVELALVKLYKVTGEEKYLELADWFLDQRGRGNGKGTIWDNPKWGAKYAQDDVPVKEQKEITGHAVRAMYLYTGAADVAVARQDSGYTQAMKTVWEDVVFRNMYVTGGIGSSGTNEGFSFDFDLPNENAYSETCASVGMVFWNQRMNALEANAQYVDVLERSLYNAALDGLSLKGDQFFYGNPLASEGQHSRREWFGTACCPSNISRLVASVGDYIYARNETGVWVNLFIANQTEFDFGGKKVPMELKANYPWEGEVTIAVDPKESTRFQLYLRVPGWAKGEAVPGGLYRFGKDPSPVILLINGEKVDLVEENGYLLIDREWKKGDLITYQLPMEVFEVYSRPEVVADRGKVALQRGPIVYCVEGADNGGKVLDALIPEEVDYNVKDYAVLDEKVKALEFQVGNSTGEGSRSLTAIPYYTWANRGKNEMQVWINKAASNN
ncbi:beta-L-arabinofuranosidase domain-containing protein [Algoriphagus sp. CAU 1675]|uniref:glycoside hydrolase family 127 protein n=1 Tax=Algoriphagus sp. CAU 1675 TaxID=3032597 RepID=UPI0023DBEEB3|nr:beta-L-arabinofuranosidase domain-containing protein [Algoriphagus sp. CAU 1675]MDF2156824.1 glycoside hydrolase family 127 protein [Algoriphagus sp. CAU 1675]